jgi:hypothetical protein
MHKSEEFFNTASAYFLSQIPTKPAGRLAGAVVRDRRRS